MPMKKYVIVYVTVPNKQLGVKIGKACVESNLVACSNIIEGVTSIYKWQGKFCQAKECILIMKTIQKNSADIIKKVQALHTTNVHAYSHSQFWVGMKAF